MSISPLDPLMKEIAELDASASRELVGELEVRLGRVIDPKRFMRTAGKLLAGEPLTEEEEAELVKVEQIAESAVAPEAQPEPPKVPREWVHRAGQVETTWKSVAEAKHYRDWLEDEEVSRPNYGLTPAEKKVLRFLQRDPRTRTPPSDPLEFKRIAAARLKRQRKHDRAVELERLSLAGKRARARALARPDTAIDDTAEVDAAAIDPSPEMPHAE